MAELLYKKEYVVNDLGSVILKNPEPALCYIEEVVKKLLETKNDHVSQLTVKCKLFNDFKAIYEYDSENSVWPEPFGYFETDKEKSELQRLKQLFEDFSLYLGCAFTSYQEQLLIQKTPILLDSKPFVIDFNELYITALQEYISAIMHIPHSVQIRKPGEKETRERKDKASSTIYKTVTYRGEELTIPVPAEGIVPKRSEHACATTYILPSLIEHFLLLYLENTVIDQWLTGMKDKTLMAEENVLYNHFRIMKNDGHGYCIGDRRKTMEALWNSGVNHAIFPTDNSMKAILCGKENGNPNTLGDILQSKYARKKIRPEYLMIMEYLFGRKNLNIRNCIAHGVSATYDYLAIGFASVMLQLLYDIATNDVVLGYEF